MSMEPHEMAEAAWEKEVAFQQRIFDKGVAAESARVREELLAEFGEPGIVEWRHLMAALDRIIPEPT